MTQTQTDTPFDPQVMQLAARLADEGLPVRAIARSLKIPSDTVREMIGAAIEDGTITEMPRDDWPPGQKRNSFGPALDNFVASDEDLRAAICRYYGTTHQQAIVLSVLLKRPEATKEQIHQAIERERGEGKEQTQIKLVDVLVCILRRKLKPHNLPIMTMWGTGYLMEAKDRVRAVKELNEFVKRTSSISDLAVAA